MNTHTQDEIMKVLLDDKNAQRMAKLLNEIKKPRETEQTEQIAVTASYLILDKIKVNATYLITYHPSNS